MPDQKEQTALMQLIEWIEQQYTKGIVPKASDISVKATSLLPVEKEIIVEARQDGIDGMLKGYTVSNNEYYDNKFTK